MSDDSSRRQFLHGDSLNATAKPALPQRSAPIGGDTVRVGTKAMGCEFAIAMNPGDHARTMAVGPVLDMIHDIENWLSAYRADSQLSLLNQRAFRESVQIAPQFFELLQLSIELYRGTRGAFDIAAGSAVQLWRSCRQQHRIPTTEEILGVLQMCGSDSLALQQSDHSVRFLVDGLQLDPGAIGKGYALDQAAEWLPKLEGGPSDFLIHGGHSSLVARGSHQNQGGWPVGIGNPLLTKKRLGTILLRDRAMSTSGSNIQFFRHQGRRYGHILDPRTALPVDGMLSVTVFADSAAVADAVSTAFFVLGVENSQQCCDNLPDIGAILIPYPKGSVVRPILVNVPPDTVFWDSDQVKV